MKHLLITIVSLFLLIGEGGKAQSELDSMTEIERPLDFYLNCDILDYDVWTSHSFRDMINFLEIKLGIFPLHQKDRGVYWEMLSCQEQVVFHGIDVMSRKVGFTKFAVFFPRKNYLESNFESFFIIDYTYYAFSLDR